MPIQPGEQPIFTAGVIADTHIPDRVNELHPQVLPILRAAGVGHILHAGDVSVPRALEALRQAAPVSAVRGNRDVFMDGLPMRQTLELGGVRVLLMHGHGGLGLYLWDKWQFLLFGYQRERYLRRMDGLRGPEQVVIFGHTHFPEALWRGGRLIFNPGSASFGYNRGDSPTLGLLRIYTGGRVHAEIIPLTGCRIEKRRWVNG